MPSTTQKLATLRPDLATFLEMELTLNRMGLVAAQIMPTFEVQSQSGNFGVIPLKAILAQANADTKRTTTGGYNRGDWEMEQRSYQTKENGWEEPVDDREEAMYSSYFDLEAIATGRAWEIVMMGLEQRVIKVALTDTIAAGRTQACVTTWRNFDQSKPIDDIQSACEAVWQRTGIWPDTVTLARRAWRALRRSKQVIDEIKASGAGVPAPSGRVTREQVAEVLDVKKIVVSDAIRNNANRAKTEVIGAAWNEDQVLVSKTPDNPSDFKSPCFGRIFHWGGDGSQIGDERMIGVVETYRDEGTRKDIVRCRHETQEFQLYPELAQAVTGVRAAP